MWFVRSDLAIGKGRYTEPSPAPRPVTSRVVRTRAAENSHPSTLFLTPLHGGGHATDCHLWPRRLRPSRGSPCTPPPTTGKMRLKEVDCLELPASADMHVHLRQGAMMELVVPQIRRGGVDTVLVCDGNRTVLFSHHTLTRCSPTFSHLSQLSLKLLNIDLTCNPLNQKSNTLCPSTFI